MRPGRILRVMAMMVGGGVIAAACSSNTPSTTTTTTVHRTTTTTGAPATSSSTTTTTGIAACAQVSVTPGQAQGAAGTIIGTVTVAEVGSGTCTVDGYPELTRYGASGSTVATTLVDGLTMDLSGPQGQPPSLVTLTSTQQAEFTFQYSDVVTGSTSCVMSSTVSVTTPGATSPSAQVPLSISACNNGTVYVSPLYASTG